VAEKLKTNMVAPLLLNVRLVGKLSGRLKAIPPIEVAATNGFVIHLTHFCYLDVLLFKYKTYGRQF